MTRLVGRLLQSPSPRVSSFSLFFLLLPLLTRSRTPLFLQSPSPRVSSFFLFLPFPSRRRRINIPLLLQSPSPRVPSFSLFFLLLPLVTRSRPPLLLQSPSPRVSSFILSSFFFVPGVSSTASSSFLEGAWRRKGVSEGKKKVHKGERGNLPKGFHPLLFLRLPPRLLPG